MQPGLELSPGLARQRMQRTLAELQAAVMVEPTPRFLHQLAQLNLARHDLAQVCLQLAPPVFAERAQSQDLACRFLMIMEGAPAAIERPDRSELRRGLRQLVGDMRQHRRRDHFHRIERHPGHAHVTNLDSDREAVRVAAMGLDYRKFFAHKREETLDLQRLEHRGEVIPAKVALPPVAHDSSSALPISLATYPPRTELHQPYEVTGYCVISACYVASSSNSRAISKTCLASLFAQMLRGPHFGVTLIGTAKLNDADPQAWLADVLARIAGHACACATCSRTARPRSITPTISATAGNTSSSSATCGKVSPAAHIYASSPGNAIARPRIVAAFLASMKCSSPEPTRPIPIMPKSANGSTNTIPTRWTSSRDRSPSVASPPAAMLRQNVS